MTAGHDDGDHLSVKEPDGVLHPLIELRIVRAYLADCERHATQVENIVPDLGRFRVNSGITEKQNVGWL